VQSLARGREALQAIKDRLGLTLEYTVAKVMELCEANKPMLTAEGCIDTPAWDARGKASVTPLVCMKHRVNCRRRRRKNNLERISISI